MLTRGKHSFKLEHSRSAPSCTTTIPTPSIGSYVFGGGSAPSSSTPITNPALARPPPSAESNNTQRALLLNLPGGLADHLPASPLATHSSRAHPVEARPLRAGRHQARAPLHHLHRTALPVPNHAPGSFLNFGLRLSLSWSPDKKQTWVLRARAGLFHNSPQGPTYATEVYRLNGVRQQQTTVYSPNYTDPLTPDTRFHRGEHCQYVPTLALATIDLRRSGQRGTRFSQTLA